MKNLLKILLSITIIFCSSNAFADVLWTATFKPGDLVCLYDIHKQDPLVDNESNDSLKYWYRKPVGDQKSVFRLRPLARGLQMRVLYPGLVATEKGDEGYWYRGQVVVVKGGVEPSKKAYPVAKGDNVLLRDFGRTIIMDWQTLIFEKARFKVNPLGPAGCRRKYDRY